MMTGPPGRLPAFVAFVASFAACHLVAQLALAHIPAPATVGDRAVQLVVAINVDHWWPFGVSPEPPVPWLVFAALGAVFGPVALWTARTVPLGVLVGVGAGAFASNLVGRATGGAVDYLALGGGAIVTSLSDVLIAVSVFAFVALCVSSRRAGPG